MLYKSISCSLFLLVFLCGCQQKGPGLSEDAYAFFVAGHTYGSPVYPTLGLHPPFREKIDMLNNDPTMAFGILAGDIVSKSIPGHWDQADETLEKFRMPIHFVAGNHDVGDRKLYESRYGPAVYAFRKNEDLFIILDSNRKNWSFNEQDLSFLKTKLNEFPDAGIIFIFSHHLIWVPGDNRFDSITLNWPPQVPDSTNFWPEVFPILNALSKPVYWFAGDLGANGPATPFMYYESENVTLIGTGMGEAKKDNMVIVRVSDGGTVDLQLVALNGNDINALGRLEDFSLKAGSN